MEQQSTHPNQQPTGVAYPQAQMGGQQQNMGMAANGNGMYIPNLQHQQFVMQLQQQQQQHMHQQQGQHPQLVLTGKPLGNGGSAAQGGGAGGGSMNMMPAMMYQTAPQQQGGGMQGLNMPLITLPGGTTIRPQLSGAHGTTNGGYPQLTGLSGGMPVMPALHYSQQQGGIPTIMSQPVHGGNGGYPVNFPSHMAVPQHIQSLPPLSAPPRAVAIKTEFGEDRPSSSHSANTSAGGLGSDGSPQVGSGGTPGSSGGNKSRYRGVSYDRKKAKWRVQIKVAALGKSGVSVGYFDTEELAARAYDRAAIGLLGRDNPNLQTNFELSDYAEEPIPRLTGKTREEVKTTLKTERIKQAPRRRFTSRQRTSRYMGVGSSNRKNQWQARILVHGKVTHLGYYETEEEAARVYDRVSLALHGDHAQTNFNASDYVEQELAPYRGLDREDLQRALGVKPMDKSSRFRGVSKKKGKWEAKVMVNRRWAYRELFDSEEEAARAYDRALWRLKPREARSYVNFKDEIPATAEGLSGGPGDFGRAVASDGDFGESDGFGDDVSDGGDFEYEYRPTKGTQRTASMRAKQRSGSAPNLAAATAAAAAIKANNDQHQVAAGGANFGAASGPAFVSLPGGGLQLQFGSGGPPPAGMIPNPGSGSMEEPLLIRVGSETHVLPKIASNNPGGQTLGKRTGLQRIQSEPQFPVAARQHQDLNLAQISGVNAVDINDLMNDRDLFRGLDLDLSAHGGGNDGDMELQALSDFMHSGPVSSGNNGGSVDHSGDVGGGGLTSLLFEDEELLANLEFEERPKKMIKSMSMNHLASLAALDTGNPGAGAAADLSPKDGSPSGRPPLPPGAHGYDSRIGPLGQPIRRINTFTSSLPSFAEGEEKIGGVHMASQHSSEEDLVKQLLGGQTHMPPSMDDSLQLLSDA